MNLLFRISSQNLIATYDRLRRMLRNNDKIIFLAMEAVTQNRHNLFIPPAGLGEFNQKHDEIKNLIRYPRVLGGREIAMNLMEEIGRRVQAAGGVVGISANEVLDEIFFEISDPDVAVRLNRDLRWVAEWTVPSPTQGDDDRSSVFLEVFSSEWGEVVPTYVIEYLNIAIYAYQQRMYGAAVALLSVAFEATLRDVLVTRGYEYDPGAPSVDVFSYESADIGVDGEKYTLTFRQRMPRSSAQFLESTDGAPTVKVQVRRVIKQRRRREDRVDLYILAPPCLIDHWSSDNVVQSGQRQVSGLGEALRIAREEEGFLTPNDLPTDLDEVIRLVRNNLIHLSGQALNTRLNFFGLPPDYTLGLFLDDAGMVFDLVVNIPRFISSQYVELRRAEHLAP